MTSFTCAVARLKHPHAAELAISCRVSGLLQGVDRIISRIDRCSQTCLGKSLILNKKGIKQIVRNQSYVPIKRWWVKDSMSVEDMFIPIATDMKTDVEGSAASSTALQDQLSIAVYLAMKSLCLS